MVAPHDGVSDINIPELLAFHKSHGRLATVTTFRPVSRFGILDIDSSKQVLNFIEKPRSDAWASAGFFVFWAFAAASSALTCFLQRTAEEINLKKEDTNATA